MTDDELRALLAKAHADDAPPTLRAVMSRPPRARRPRWVAVAVAVAAAAALAAVLARPRAPTTLAISYRAPLDFLLDVPGDNLLRDLPRFDLKGTLP